MVPFTLLWEGTIGQALIFPGLLYYMNHSLISDTTSLWGYQEGVNVLSPEFSLTDIMKCCYEVFARSIYMGSRLYQRTLNWQYYEQSQGRTCHNIVSNEGPLGVACCLDLLLFLSYALDYI